MFARIEGYLCLYSEVGGDKPKGECAALEFACKASIAGVPLILGCFSHRFRIKGSFRYVTCTPPLSLEGTSCLLRGPPLSLEGTGRLDVLDAPRRLLRDRILHHSTRRLCQTPSDILTSAHHPGLVRVNAHLTATITLRQRMPPRPSPASRLSSSHRMPSHTYPVARRNVVGVEERPNEPD